MKKIINLFYVFILNNPYLYNLIVWLKNKFKVNYNYLKELSNLVNKYDKIIIVGSLMPYEKMFQRPQQISLSFAKNKKDTLIIYHEIDLGSIFKHKFKKILPNLVITNKISKESFKKKKNILLYSYLTDAQIIYNDMLNIKIGSRTVEVI